MALKRYKSLRRTYWLTQRCTRAYIASISVHLESLVGIRECKYGEGRQRRAQRLESFLVLCFPGSGKLPRSFRPKILVALDVRKWGRSKAVPGKELP